MSRATTEGRASQHGGRFVARARRFARAAGVFSALVGALVLAGWLFDVPTFKSVYAGITMKANAALSFLLTGASLWLTGVDERGGVWRRAGQACAAAAGLLGLLTLSEHLTGLDLRIDQLLFTEPAGELATASPGRMGPLASSCFALSGAALLLLHARRVPWLSQLFSVVVCLLLSGSWTAASSSGTRAASASTATRGARPSGGTTTNCSARSSRLCSKR